MYKCVPILKGLSMYGTVEISKNGGNSFVTLEFGMVHQKVVVKVVCEERTTRNLI